MVGLASYRKGQVKQGTIRDRIPTLSPDLWPLTSDQEGLAKFLGSCLNFLASFGKRDEMESISMSDSPATS